MFHSFAEVSVNRPPGRSGWPRALPHRSRRHDGGGRLCSLRPGGAARRQPPRSAIEGLVDMGIRESLKRFAPQGAKDVFIAARAMLAAPPLEQIVLHDYELIRRCGAGGPPEPCPSHGSVERDLRRRRDGSRPVLRQRSGSRHAGSAGCGRFPRSDRPLLHRERRGTTPVRTRRHRSRSPERGHPAAVRGRE